MSISVACACGQLLQIADQHAGRQFKCPRCGAVLTVPAAKPPPPPPRPAAPPPLTSTPPAPPPKTRPLWPMIVGAGVVLLVIAVVVGILVFKGGERGDLGAVPGDAQGFVSVRVADLWTHSAGRGALTRLPDGVTADSLAAQMEQLVGVKPTDVERVTGALVDPENGVVWARVTLTKEVDENKILDRVAALGRGRFAEKTHNGKKYHYLAQADVALHFARPTLLIVASEEGMKRCLDQKGGKASGVMARGLDELKGKHHLTAAFVATDWTAKAIRADVARGPLAPLGALAEAQGLLVQLDAGARTELELTLTFDSDGKAAGVQSMLETTRHKALTELDRLRQQRDLVESLTALSEWQRVLNDAVLELRGREVVIRVQVGDTAMAEAPTFARVAVLKVRETIDRQTSADNLRRLFKAMRAYAADHEGRLPPCARYGAKGELLWSWRVELLPYLGKEEAAMYQQLKQDEPSNGPHNRTVLAKMPKVYHMPGKPKSSLTYYQVFQGPGATFNVTHRQGPRLDAIPDGPGNTILISESREPAAWADAQDLPFRGGKGVPLLTREQLGLPDRPFQVIMFDGTVRLLSPTVDPQHLTWAVMPDDAQELPDRWWEGK